MSKGVKIALWIIAGLVAIVGIVVWIGMSIWNKITFENFKFSGVDFNGIGLKDLQNIVSSDESKSIFVTIGMDIKNESNVSIEFCNFRAILFYEGEEIARSGDALANSCKTIPKKGILPLSDTVNIKLSKAGVKMLLAKLLKGKVDIDYEIELSALGISKTLIPTIKQTYTW